VLWKSNVSFLQDGTEIYSARVSDWTRDLKFIVTGTSNGKLQIWEAETGRLVWNVRWNSVAYEKPRTSPGLRRGLPLPPGARVTGLRL